MLKTTKTLSVLALLGLTIWACEPTETTTPQPPTNPVPTADGTLIVEFTNQSNAGTPTVTAANGDAVDVSLLIKKGTDNSRPKTLEIYVATEPNVRGNRFLEPITLRNRDEQTKTIEYTVSQTSGKVYMYFDVIDNNAKISRKSLIINVSSQGQVALWKEVTLGAQSNALGSRVAAATGDVYPVCDLEENMKYVDITYAAIGSTTALPTLLSNPQRATEGLRTTASASSGCEGQNTGGGTPTYFALAPNTVNFNDADDAILNGLMVSNTSPQKITVEAGKIYMFLNSLGKKGLIIVHEVVPGVAGTIRMDIKVQK